MVVDLDGKHLIRATEQRYNNEPGPRLSPSSGDGRQAAGLLLAPDTYVFWHSAQLPGLQKQPY